MTEAKLTEIPAGLANPISMAFPRLILLPNKLLARSFPLPQGKRAIGTAVPARASATSLKVPSPPRHATTSASNRDLALLVPSPLLSVNLMSGSGNISLRRPITLLAILPTLPLPAVGFTRMPTLGSLN